MSYLREALAAGDSGHIATALAKEASIEGALRGAWWRRRGGRLLARAGEIAASSGIPDVVGTVHTCWGSYYYFGSRWAARPRELRAGRRDLPHALRR